MRSLIIASTFLGACSGSKTAETPPETKAGALVGIVPAKAKDVELKLYIAEPDGAHAARTEAWKKQQIRFYRTLDPRISARSRSGDEDASIKVDGALEKPPVDASKSKCELDLRLHYDEKGQLVPVDEGNIKCTYGREGVKPSEDIATMFDSLYPYLATPPLVIADVAAEEMKLDARCTPDGKKVSLEYWTPTRPVGPPTPRSVLELSCKVPITERDAGIKVLADLVTANHWAVVQDPIGKTEIAIRWGYAR